ncbi:MAG: hypothetical protein SO169_07835 [Parabacteroides sp.]|nr:hypothetical protein [Parabacteroides sp.]
MNILERMPKELQNQVFTNLKNIAEIAQMSPDERLIMRSAFFISMIRRTRSCCFS